jgi:L-cysteine desulfidase
MGFLQLLSALLGLLPNILAAVQAVEVAFPKARGSDKLNAVTAAVSAAAAHTSEIVGQVEQIRAPVQRLISEVVSTLNDAGVFSHAADVPVATTRAAPSAQPAAPARYDTYPQYDGGSGG